MRWCSKGFGASSQSESNGFFGANMHLQELLVLNQLMEPKGDTRSQKDNNNNK